MHDHLNDMGKLILRIALGALILLHGVAKLRHGIDPIHAMVAGAGMPDVVAYGVYAGEVLGPLLLIAGFYARIGALLIAIDMLFAFALAHTTQLANFTANGGWELELQGMFLFTAVALVLLGPGRFAINAR